MCRATWKMAGADSDPSDRLPRLASPLTPLDSCPRGDSADRSISPPHEAWLATAHHSTRSQPTSDLQLAAQDPGAPGGRLGARAAGTTLKVSAWQIDFKSLEGGGICKAPDLWLPGLQGKAAKRAFPLSGRHQLRADTHF